MDAKLYAELTQKASDYLHDGMIRQALDTIESLLIVTNDWDDVQALHDASSTYGQMCGYLLEGLDDPDMDVLLSNINRTLMRLLEKTRRSYELRNSDTPLTRMLLRMSINDVPEDMLDGELNPAMRFNRVWSSPLWTEQDAEQLLTYITVGASSLEERALLVSATMLGAWYYFDPRKVLTLLQLCRDQDDTVRLRAQVGVVLLTLKRGWCFRFYDYLQQELAFLVSDEEVAAQLRTIQVYLLASQHTKEACRRMATLFEKIPDLAGSDPSHEQVKEKMQGIFRLYMDSQETRADLNYDSFSAMRRLCGDFFDVPANWFWPFSLSHPDLADFSMPRHLEALFALQRHTHTDRYAFVSLVRGREIKVQTEGLEDGESIPLSELPIKPNPDADVAHYVFDLYRFFTIYLDMEEGHPFEGNLQMIDSPLLREVYRSEDDVVKLIKLDMRNHDYESALTLLERLLPKHPHSVWTLRSIAKCHYEQGNYNEAYDFYNAVLAYEPDNERVRHQMLHALLAAEREAEALPMLYKSYYLHPDDIEVQRQLGWCQYRMREADAIDTLIRITQHEDAAWQDHCRLGGAYLLNGQLAEAIREYMEAYDSATPDDVSNAILGERRWLESQGVPPEHFGLLQSSLYFLPDE